MMPNNTTDQHDQRAERLAALKREYAERRASLPAHSVPAAQLIRLEELEDEIAALRAEMASEGAPSS
jgi:ribosomal protein L29